MIMQKRRALAGRLSPVLPALVHGEKCARAGKRRSGEGRDGVKWGKGWRWGLAVVGLYPRGSEIGGTSTQHILPRPVWACNLEGMGLSRLIAQAGVFFGAREPITLRPPACTPPV